MSMIRDDAELAVQQELLSMMEGIVQRWRERLLPRYPENFALYAEGAIEQAEKLRAEIDEYLQRRKAPTTPAAEHAISSETARGTAFR